MVGPYPVPKYLFWGKGSNIDLYNVGLHNILVIHPDYLLSMAHPLGLVYWTLLQMFSCVAEPWQI